MRGLAKDGTGHDYAINNAGSGWVVLRNNDVFGDGSAGSNGLHCTSPTVVAKDNIIDGFATALSTCADLGGNDITH